jgi:hypothetical protein
MGDMLTVIALVAIIAAGVAIPLALVDSAERFGDDLREWAECKEDDHDD